MGRAPRASLQEEDPDCGGVAAVHYGGVGTSRPACHQQRSEAVAKKCRCKLRTFRTSVVNVLQLLLLMFSFIAT